MPRIIVDCTHTFQTGARTGIQRVVRRYADSLFAIAPAAGVQVVPVRLADGKAIPLPLQDGRVAFPDSESARERVVVDERLDRMRLAGLRANRLLRSRRLESWFGAGPNEDGLARWLAGRGVRKEYPDAVRFAPTDVFLSLDSSWVYDIRSVLDEAGSAGATRAIVLCDVLPLSNPQWFTEGTRRYFRGWIGTLLPRLEGVIGISQTSCDELCALAAAGEFPTRSVPPCRAVHLGAELAPQAAGEIRPQLRAALAGDAPPAFLTVGTLEPRKNVEFAIDLFDALASRDLDFQWHVVGSPGWLADHTAHRIRSHPAHGERLHWWTDLNDAELAYCYRSARALVAVSKAEGFGLPLVEARLQGSQVFASDIPVFREVMGGEARYLPLSNARLAAASLEDFLTGASPPPAQGPSRIARTWEACAEELLDAVLGFAPRRAAA